MVIITDFLNSRFWSCENYERFKKDPITGAADDAAFQIREFVNVVLKLNPDIDRKLLISRIICKLSEI